MVAVEHENKQNHATTNYENNDQHSSFNMRILYDALLVLLCVGYAKVYFENEGSDDAHS